jgi:hypothetical protein
MFTETPGVSIVGVVAGSGEKYSGVKHSMWEGVCNAGEAKDVEVRLRGCIKGCVEALWRRSFCCVRVSFPCVVVKGIGWSCAARDVED